VSSVPPNSELIKRLEEWDADIIVRDKERTKKTGEVFTPTALVCEILDKMPQSHFTDPTETFFDPSCGNGQFLSEVLRRKLANGIAFDVALKTIYGIDIMLDNVDVCRQRLLCGVTQLAPIVEKNIICADALTFNFDEWQGYNE